VAFSLRPEFGASGSARLAMIEANSRARVRSQAACTAAPFLRAILTGDEGRHLHDAWAQPMCSIPLGSPTQGCMQSSHTETRGAGKFGSANAPTGTAMCSGPADQ
jgi:hypothetical protein